MTDLNKRNGQTDPLPVLVLGLDGDGKPQAARFGASQAELASKAASLMGLRVAKIESGELAALAQKVPAGRLYANGKGFVPNVRRDLYGKILEVAGLTPEPASTPTDNGDPAKSLPGLPERWEDIEVGHLVVARETSTWYEAQVIARDGDMLTLKWRDYPHQGPSVQHRSAVALLRPNAD